MPLLIFLENVYPLNIANILGCEPNEIADFLVKKEGDTVEKDTVIAETPGIWGFFKSFVKSPIRGTIESLSTVTGQAILREPPIPVEVLSYVDELFQKFMKGKGLKLIL